MTKPSIHDLLFRTHPYTQHALHWHTLLTFMVQTLAILVNEEHHPPHTDQASLTEFSWLQRSSIFGRHHISVFPQGNYQKRARLLRRVTPGHTYTPLHSLEKYPDSQELMDSTGGLPAVGTVGKGTGQGTTMCLIYCI